MSLTSKGLVYFVVAIATIAAVPAAAQSPLLGGPGTPQYDITHGQNTGAYGGGTGATITSRPNPLGGSDYSNGVSSRPNPLGGYDYSNGRSCRPNPLGGMDCR
jgi:hypothetical protein